jgi:hypothetical protein
MAEGDVFMYGRTPWSVAFQAFFAGVWKATAFLSPRDRESNEAAKGYENIKSQDRQVWN